MSKLRMDKFRLASLFSAPQPIRRHAAVHVTFLLILSGSLLSFSSGCNSSSSSSSSAGQAGTSAEKTFSGDYPIKATVTVGMVADLVRIIGGEHVEVQQLMSAGVDPHLHTPTRDDSAAIIGADIVLYNGLLLEGKMSDVLERTQKSRRTFAAGESLPKDILFSDPEIAGHPDPHVWMNVDLWRQVALSVGEELAAFDVKHADEYRSRAKDLASELALLHSYGQEILACVEKEKRVLVTSHDAFRYFGKAYGIDVQAVQGISTDSEAGLTRINELVDILVQRKVQAAFIESSVPKKSIQSILQGASKRGHEVAIGGTLFSDAMGNEGTYEGTYIGMMDHNLSTIARSLGCESVPERGFRDYKDNLPSKDENQVQSETPEEVAP